MTTSTVKLQTPLQIGEKKIHEITVREPKAGELRGIKLLDVIQMDVAAYETLLPRITDPALTVDQIRDFSASQIMEFMDKVGNAFAPSS